MRSLLITTYAFILLYSVGCNKPNNTLTLYHDNIIGNFNGKDIDTLIAEPINTTIDRSLWNWRVYSKNNTVDTLILSQRHTVRLIQEGDLDGNGTDEFGVRREAEAGTWDNYCVYTYYKGEWEYLINPIWTYSDHFYTDLNSGNDVVTPTNSSNLVKVRFSDIRNDDFCIVDTIMPIAIHAIPNQEQ